MTVPGAVSRGHPTPPPLAARGAAAAEAPSELVGVPAAPRQAGARRRTATPVPAAAAAAARPGCAGGGAAPAPGAGLSARPLARTARLWQSPQRHDPSGQTAAAAPLRAEDGAAPPAAVGGCQRVGAALTAGLALLGGSLLLLGGAVGDDARSRNIGVLRAQLEGATSPPLAGPSGAPAPRLNATWAPAWQGAPRRHEFELALHDVPLTGSLFSDWPDVDDEESLPVGEHLRSTFYRAVVPLSALEGGAGASPNSAGGAEALPLGDKRGTLEIWRPDGARLLSHQLELASWRPPAAELELGWDAPLLRVCYAVQADDEDVNGAHTQDCEHGVPNPMFASSPPASGGLDPRSASVEILVRGHSDVYVSAHSVTGGCSSCFGDPMGGGAPGAAGAASRACALPPAAPAAPLRAALGPLRGLADLRPVAGRCFGRPRRHAQAAGLALLALAAALLRAAVVRPGPSARATALELATGALLLAAAACLAALPGSLRRGALRGAWAPARWAALLLGCGLAAAFSAAMLRRACRACRYARFLRDAMHAKPPGA